MGRTTLRIDDELLRRLRRRAAEEDRPAASDYRLELEGWEADLERILDSPGLHLLSDFPVTVPRWPSSSRRPG